MVDHDPGEVETLPDVELIDGFGVRSQSVAERRLDPGPQWKVAFIAVVVLAAAGFGISLFLGDDDVDAEAEAPPTTPAPTSVTTTTPPRTTLPAVSDAEADVDLPGVRPDAVLFAKTETGLYELDMETGASHVLPLSQVPSQLFVLGGVVLGDTALEVLRIDPETGEQLLVADSAPEVRRGYGPDALVTVQRDGSGVVARVVGPDGVFRAGARLPGEAVVYGAVGDRLIVGLAGRVIATDGDDRTVEPEPEPAVDQAEDLISDAAGAADGTADVSDDGADSDTGAEPEDSEPGEQGGFVVDPLLDTATELGPGRVIGIGADRIVLVQCSIDVCRLRGVTPDGTVVNDVPVPDPLASAAPERWSRVGWISPDATSVLVELRHGNGSVIGAVSVDLETGEGRHSPELGLGFGTPAWAPDSRFVVYPFDGDVMIWDTEAAPGHIPSARAVVGHELSDITLLEQSTR